MIKKTTAVLLAAVFCLLCTSCSVKKPEAFALKVSGAEIDKEIFAYYFDKIVARPGDYGFDENASANDYADKAVELCIRYVAVNTMFANHNLKLSNAQKTEISDNVSALWTSYGNHYKKIGVSRSTISRIQTNSTREDTIFSSLFDKGDESAEKKIKEYFASNYIIFRAVCGYYITTDAAGSDIEMNASQKEQMRKLYAETASKIKDIGGVEDAAAALGSSATSTILLKKEQCEGYPTGFFNAVVNLENNKASVLSFGDCVFLIWKYDPALREKEYAACRSQCLKDMYSAYGEASFKALEETFKVNRNEGVIGKFITDIDIYG